MLREDILDHTVNILASRCCYVLRSASELTTMINGAHVEAMKLHFREKAYFVERISYTDVLLPHSCALRSSRSKHEGAPSKT